MLLLGYKALILVELVVSTRSFWNSSNPGIQTELAEEEMNLSSIFLI